MGLLDSKVAIVTGAGGGLGRAHALALAKEGAAVVINDLGVSRDGASEGARFADLVVDEIKAMGGRAVANYDSVATEEGARGIAKSALDAFGRIDILVNNAGILRDKTFVKSTKEMWDPVIAVHLTGMYLVTHACVPHMQAVGGGSIISTTSLAGLKGNYGQANYAAAKAGIWGMTHVLAIELGRSGIRANTLAPVAKTRMTEELDMVPDDLKPEMVAPMVVFLASDLAKDVTDRCFGCHGPQIFEYVMTTTQGAVRDDGMWTPSEISARIGEIASTGAAAAPKAEAKAGPSNEQQALLDEVFGRFGEGFVPERAGDWKATLHFVIEGAADYTVRVAAGKVETEKGKKGDASCVITFGDADTFLGVVTGKLRPDKAFMSGKIKASDMGELMKFAQSFDMSAGARKSGEIAPAAKAVSMAALGKKFRVESEFAEPAHIAAYAAAIGDSNAAYAADGRAAIAPPLFAVRALHRIAMPMLTDPELGADLARLVHGEQDMTFFAPIRPWDVLVPRGEITSIDEKASGTLIRTTQRLLVDGKAVAECVSGYFVRGAKKPEAGEAKPAAAAPAAETRTPLFEVRREVKVEEIAAYAHASLDTNPIHLDDAIAKAAGLPGIIAHGLFTMGLAQSALINTGLGGDPTRLKRFSVRFARPVLPGQTLTFRGYAAEGGRIDLDARNDAGEPVLLHAFAEVG
jgi:NAD(P)-dependent dehydrogenase (short-subunit alcohol dehydrogenase family)/acyl dehydratase/putative sterol carrier protein